MPKKRSNGEGTIYLRPNGLWAAGMRLPGGRRKYVYGKTREEVRRKLLDLMHARQAGTVTDSRGLTLGAFLDQWLTNVVKPTVRHWTYTGYEVHVRLHIKPALGRIPLERLTPMQVQAWMNQKLQQGLAPKSVRYMRGTLRTALNQAVRWGLIPRNPATLVEPPRARRYEINPLSPDEARRLLEAVKGDRLEALYSVALSLGLRQGEALGLRWSDVHLEAGHLTVSKQLQRIDGRFQLVELKTERSLRSLVMPTGIIAALIAHRARQHEERKLAGERWKEHGLVFAGIDGSPLEGTTVTRTFHRVLARTGLEQRRFHDLRHSCATLLLVQGVSPRVVMEILGHSEIAMTMNTYSHVVPELRREAADRMQDLLWRDTSSRAATDHQRDTRER